MAFQSRPTISVVGSLNVDLVARVPRVPSAGETLTASGFETGHGGKGANQAIACARLSRSARQAPKDDDGSVHVRMIGAVGDDQFGREFRDALQKDGIDVEGVKVVESDKTGVAFILVEDATGENRIIVSPGANYKVDERPLLGENTTLAVFQLEIPIEVVLLNIKDAKARCIDVLLNPAPAVPLPDELYQGLGHLIINESEAVLLSGKPMGDVTLGSDLTLIALHFLEKGVKNVIITLGATGVFYHTATRKNEGLSGKLIEAKRVKVVDTTAAGDTFVGAYAVAVARSKSQTEQVAFDIDAAVAFANKAAARTVERKGAQSAIPWLDEVTAGKTEDIVVPIPEGFARKSDYL